LAAVQQQNTNNLLSRQYIEEWLKLNAKNQMPMNYNAGGGKPLIVTRSDVLLEGNDMVNAQMITDANQVC